MPTLSDDAIHFDPFEQAVRAGAGRTAALRAVDGRPVRRSGDVRRVRRAAPDAAPRDPAPRDGAPRDRAPRDGAPREAAARGAARCQAGGAKRVAGEAARAAVGDGPARDGAARVPAPRRPEGPRSAPGRKRRVATPRAADPRRAPHSAGAPPVRLTRRGRALVRSVALVGVALTAFAFSVSTRADGVTPVSSRSMVVTERDTLWTIAEDIAPDRPRSETMAEIRELNDMSDSTVRVGERLLLPAH
ncbi:LysM peptidoglycan-binding domain-containing protein [Cryptosporangium aurantiacum]|uniref:LysM peptidoglycan-binding domain-containing protein n=1 Tax=Cryptosporangium aurantiacum TaxID=134849 RepID=UPI0011612B77|nr:LysM peptidoglycan-binding domain-containing protein [Cryptosporangium aurantiacum]